MTEITKLKWALFLAVIDFIYIAVMWVMIYFALLDKDWAQATFWIGCLILNEKQNGKN